MSNVKLFNSLFMFAVSTTSLELTHIPEVTQSDSFKSCLKITAPFKAQCRIGKRVGLFGSRLA